MRLIRSISASLFALATATVGAALAADLPARPLVKAPVPAAPPPFSWTGFYIGANIGGAWAGGDITNDATGASVGVGSSGAFIGGGQLGYNYQFYSNWVIGIEGTIDGVGSNDKTTGTVVIGPNTFNAFGRARWDATLAGRLGYAADNWLFYAKGGGAWVGVDATVNNLTTGASISRSASQGGWMAGGGVEWAFAPNWSAKLEYDFLGINGEQIGTNTGTIFTLHNPNVQQVTVGVNYLFR
jgi:outer membrane immunogenic protein